VAGIADVRRRRRIDTGDMNTHTTTTQSTTTSGNDSSAGQSLGRKRSTYRSRPSTRFIVVFSVMIAYAAVLIGFLIKGYQVTAGVPFIALSIYGSRLGKQTRLVRVHEHGLSFGTVDSLQSLLYSNIAQVRLASATAVEMLLLDGRTVQLTAGLSRAPQLVEEVQSLVARAHGWSTATVAPVSAPAAPRQPQAAWAPPAAPPAPVAPHHSFAPPAPVPSPIPPTAMVPVLQVSPAKTGSSRRAAVVATMVVAALAAAGLAARSLGTSDSVAAAGSKADTSTDVEETDATDQVATTAATVAVPESTMPRITLPSMTVPPETAAPDTTVAPETTAAPETTVPAHQLAQLQVGNCLDASDAIVGCARGTQLVTAVSAAPGLACNGGETAIEITQTPAAPSTVSACLVPWYLDDRSLTQVFDVDTSCATPSADERSAFEVELLKCRSTSGASYYLAKVQEGQIAVYLREVLAASFLGDWSTTDGEVCGGHFQSDGWNVYVYGNGPFVEYRQLDDTEGVTFSRSLCVA
jgi:type VI secretion system secreted protein VgrG